MSETLQATDDVEASSPAEAEAAAEPSQSKTEDLLVQEGDIAGDYLERLLDGQAAAGENLDFSKLGE